MHGCREDWLLKRALLDERANLVMSEPNSSALAVVTGASSGMGRSTGERFLDAGWSVLALDVHPGQCETAGLINCQVDVRDRAALETAIAGHVLENPSLTLRAVANVAGIYPPTTVDTYTEESYRQIFDINVLGTLNVIAACLPHLAAGASIVNFASVDAFTVSPGQLLYGASKAAVVMLTKALALELAPRDIRVNAVAPGWVATPGNAATGRMAEAAAGIPLGRVAQPEEIAEWVWLLSGSGYNSFVTGETIVLSGGDVLR